MVSTQQSSGVVIQTWAWTAAISLISCGPSSKEYLQKISQKVPLDYAPEFMLIFRGAGPSLVALLRCVVCENGRFEPFVHTNAIILPRQARDKHRESTQKRPYRFLIQARLRRCMHAVSRLCSLVRTHDRISCRHLQLLLF